jgi:SAM-dependent methyltransferase
MNEAVGRPPVGRPAPWKSVRTAVITSPDYVCPVHGRPLSPLSDALACPAGHVFPVIDGVAIIVDGVRIEPRHDPLPADVIDQVLPAFELPESTRPAVEQVFRHQFRFVEDWIQVEADQFLHRVAASHQGLHGALEDAADDAADVMVNVDPAVRIASIFTMPRVRPGERSTINVRVTNVGPSTLSSTHPQPVLLAYHWIAADGAVEEGHRTKFLDDIVSGHAMTVPMFIDNPAQPGSYRLRLRALQEGVRWFDDSEVEFAVEVGEGAATTDDPAWTRTTNQYEYFQDHQEALRLIEEWRGTRFARPVERIVELGGNASPMLLQVEAPQRINIDVDPFGMIMGKLRHGPSQPTLEFVVADGMAMPLAPRSIDILMMFATFHHFPDPIGLLSRLAEFVADDGLICLMSEPIGHPHADYVDAGYVAELRRGVNEQSFTLWEYQQMFDAAGLDVAAAQIDIGSAKIALRPRRGRA